MSLSILVVDDEPFICKILSKCLINLGYNPTYVKSAEDAIEYLKTNSPDLVITDLNLHKMTGDKLILYIKKEYPKIKTLLMSGIFIVNSLSKPFTKEELSDHISLAMKS